MLALYNIDGYCRFFAYRHMRTLPTDTISPGRSSSVGIGFHFLLRYVYSSNNNSHNIFIKLNSHINLNITGFTNANTIYKI